MSTGRQKNAGLALLEVVVASSILLVIVTTVSISYQTYLAYALANKNRVQAAYIAEEGLEAVTFLRDSGWTAYIATLSPGVTYYLYITGSMWRATTTPQYVDGQFLRSFVVANVNRDTNSEISPTGANDPNTKQITATVAYVEGHATTTQSLSIYLTNINND